MRKAIQYFIDYWEGDKSDTDSTINKYTMTQDLGCINIDSDSEASSEFIQPIHESYDVKDESNNVSLPPQPPLAQPMTSNDDLPAKYIENEDDTFTSSVLSSSSSENETSTNDECDNLSQILEDNLSDTDEECDNLSQILEDNLSEILEDNLSDTDTDDSDLSQILEDNLSDTDDTDDSDLSQILEDNLSDMDDTSSEDEYYVYISSSDSLSYSSSEEYYVSTKHTHTPRKECIVDDSDDQTSDYDISDDQTSDAEDNEIIVDDQTSDNEIIVDDISDTHDSDVEQEVYGMTESELLTYDDIISMTEGYPYCIEDGSLYIWSSEINDWKHLIDLFIWDYENEEWVDFKGSLQDFENYVNFNTHTQQDEIPYQLLNDENDIEDEDVIVEDRVFDDELNIPLLSEYNDACWKYDGIQSAWVYNPVYGDTSETNDEFNHLTFTGIVAPVCTEESDYDITFNDDDYDNTTDDDNLYKDYAFDENSISFESSESEDVTIEESLVNELYNRWFVNEYRTLEEKFGLSEHGNLTLGDLYVNYQKHLLQIHRLYNLFERYPILNTIKGEVLNVYEKLITKFLSIIFISCDYRIMTQEERVCDNNGNDLFSIQDFILKYLDLINQRKSLNNILDALKNHRHIPHIATVKVYMHDEHGNLVIINNKEKYE